MTMEIKTEQALKTIARQCKLADIEFHGNSNCDQKYSYYIVFIKN